MQCKVGCSESWETGRLLQLIAVENTQMYMNVSGWEISTLLSAEAQVHATVFLEMSE